MEIGPVRQILAIQVGTPATPAERPPEHRELIEAVRAVNASEFVGDGNELTFAFDRETKSPLVRIVNRETREVVQQIPAEYLLRLAKELKLNNSYGLQGRKPIRFLG